MKFSHSSISEYDACPRKYKINRIDKIRPIKVGSPLIFGSALDDASEVILLRYKKELTDEQNELLKLSPLEVYVRCMAPHKHSTEVKYSNADLQMELLDAQDWKEIGEYSRGFGLEIEDWDEFVKDCRTTLKKDIMSLDKELELVYNLIVWNSLRQKAIMLLPLLEQWCVENIAEVHSVQEPISLPDGEDEVRGFLDFEATLLNGERRVIDLKTAAKAYKMDEADNSQQLTIYGEYKENNLVAFLVLEKNIRKREPRGRIQYVPGTITEAVRDEILGNVAEKVDEIKSDTQFLKNTDSCWMYGRCQYFDLCKMGLMDGLKKKDE